MKNILFLLILFSETLTAGSLYTFDRHVVLMNALGHIQIRYSDLAKTELSPRPLTPYLDKTGKLVVDVFFSYIVDGMDEPVFVCAKVDENGKLLNVARDIKARKTLNKFYMPDTSRCWGQP